MALLRFGPQEGLDKGILSAFWFTILVEAQVALLVKEMDIGLVAGGDMRRGKMGR